MLFSQTTRRRSLKCRRHLLRAILVVLFVAGTSTGWAGRMSDLLGSSFNPSATIPMITSVAGDTLFCDG